uniref:Uncharacterized protein n=1 Tax=Arundo donax TaxID=35708 RepID=A0A0A8ZVM9_ARUDO
MSLASLSRPASQRICISTVWVTTSGLHPASSIFPRIRYASSNLPAWPRTRMQMV